MDKLKVLEYEINTKIINQEDYVSLTDIAKKVNEDEPRFVIQNWMRNKDTIDYLGLWESIYNPNFNRVGFEAVENEAGRMDLCQVFRHIFLRIYIIFSSFA